MENNHPPICLKICREIGSASTLGSAPLRRSGGGICTVADMAASLPHAHTHTYTRLFGGGRGKGYHRKAAACSHGTSCNAAALAACFNTTGHVSTSLVDLSKCFDMSGPRVAVSRPYRGKSMALLGANITRRTSGPGGDWGVGGLARLIIGLWGRKRARDYPKGREGVWGRGGG